MKTIGRFVTACCFVVCANVWAGPVNVNSADAATIAKEINGVGTAIAAKIVAERQNGKFKDASDLQKRVKGIGEKTVSKNKDNLQF